MSVWDNLHPEFARRLQAMISAAAAEGRTIGIGSGYRTVEEQIALRKKNGCPDVWTSPASSCRVPTAIPGRSRHNSGLAADITGDKAWANANAARFGLHFNVTGEDWHVEPINIEDLSEGGGAVDQYGRPISFGFEYMDEPANPEDELADRIHAVMRTLGSATGPIETPEDMANPQQLATDVTTIPSSETFRREVSGGGGPVASNEIGEFARRKLAEFGWDESQFPALVELWNRESGDPQAGSSRVTWNPNAQNPTSTAFGIAQFLDGTWAGTGFQKTSDPFQQIMAGLTYIKGRYGTPQAALSFHDRKNWY